MAVVLSVLAFCTMLLTLRTVFSEGSPDETLIARRLRDLSSSTPVVDLRKVELSAPLWERLAVPPIRWFMEQVSKRTPRQVLEETRTKLEAAGNPWNMKPVTFVAIRLCSCWSARLFRAPCRSVRRQEGPLRSCLHRAGRPYHSGVRRRAQENAPRQGDREGPARRARPPHNKR